MFKRYIKELKDFIKEEYKFIICLFSLYIICIYPVNYYIIIGGGISDIDSRVQVENEYKSKGSFNISYVTQIEGRIATYLLSYIITDWKRVKISDYKYIEEDEIEDINFRSELDLKNANSTAIKWAYTLAEKDYEITDTKIYVILSYPEYKSPLKVGDEILSINNHSFKTLTEYQEYIQTLDINNKVSIELKRNNETKIINCKLHRYEDRLILGVALQVVNEYKVNPAVEFHFKKNESGPSGGLITTLSIYDKLTKEDLTANLKIAGTGTIEEDGTIGEIGEVKYKLLGAISDEADIFLVPNGQNYKDCIALKKERNLDIKIIGVSTIEEAIEQIKRVNSKK